MNASGLPQRSFGVPTGVRLGSVDLGDERTIGAALRSAGFSRSDIHQLAEGAIDRTRTALQAVGRHAARAAEPGALLLLIVVWVIGYVGLNPPAHAPRHHAVEVAHV